MRGYICNIIIQMRRQTFLNLAFVVLPTLLPAADFDIPPRPQCAKRLSSTVHFPTTAAIPAGLVRPQLKTAERTLEPMELINAGYSWNQRSTGFFQAPSTYKAEDELFRRYALEVNQPGEIFGPGGLSHCGCRLLYGEKASEIMASYYQLSAELTETPARPPQEGRPMMWLPLTSDRAYAAASHWFRNL